MENPQDESNTPVQKGWSCSYTRSFAILTLVVFVPTLFILCLVDGITAFIEKNYALKFGYWKNVIQFFAFVIGVPFFVLIMTVIEGYCSRKTVGNIRPSDQPSSREE